MARKAARREWTAGDIRDLGLAGVGVSEFGSPR